MKYPTGMIEPYGNIIAELEIITEPEDAFIIEMKSENKYPAPVKLYYQWDKKNVIDNCFGINGFTAVWPDGTTVSTDKIITMCNGPNAYKITFSKENLFSPSPTPDIVFLDESDLCTAISDASLFAEDGTYLGKIANEHITDSILNIYGTFGSPYSSESIWNEYGLYGGKYSEYSPLNPGTSSPPKILKNGNLMGYLTVNDNIRGAVNPYQVQSCFSSTITATSYIIEEITDKKNLLISGAHFRAKKDCSDWEKGDRVIFLEGSLNGLCISAKLFNLDKIKSCEVLCE